MVHSNSMPKNRTTQNIVIGILQDRFNMLLYFSVVSFSNGSYGGRQVQMCYNGPTYFHKEKRAVTSETMQI